MSDYAAFIDERSAYADGASVPSHEKAVLNSRLFDHQEHVVRWALARGRAAVFADTGLGKTIIQLEWARVVNEAAGRVLILAPLAVADQTIAEAGRFDVEGCKYLRDDDGVTPIAVTNYEMMAHFDPSHFAGIVLDESSILKSYTGAFRTKIIETYQETPFRLACTATPAPNDFTELGNHAEFLGIKSRVEMLAEYFINDTGDTTSAWRLKGHAETAFWRWVARWARMYHKPGDIGFSNEGYILPRLDLLDIVVHTDTDVAQDAGMLFMPQAMTLHEQRAVRRATIPQRTAEVVKVDKLRPNDPLLVWCQLNDEADAIEAAIPDAVQVAGSDPLDDKREKLMAFGRGDVRVLVTKPSIAGFGMNWQHCNRVVFAGASHSYEQTYQAVRRCWRFGQKRAVNVWMIRTDREHTVWENYRRKEADAHRLSAGMRNAMMDVVAPAQREWNPYDPTDPMELPEWL